jgi:hypothetical protein
VFWEEKVKAGFAYLDFGDSFNNLTFKNVLLHKMESRLIGTKEAATIYYFSK